MANLIKLKRSAVAGKAPAVGDLELGELALNTYDGKLYAKKDNGTASIVEIGAGGSVASGGFAAGSASAPSVFFTDDSNTGLYNYTPDGLALSTGGTGRVFLNGSGRVGFGTSTLGVPVTIQADSGQASIRIAGRAADDISYAEFTSSNQAVTYGYFSSGPSYLATGVGATEATRINASGQIGFGDQTFNHDYSFYKSSNTTIRLANSTSTTAANRGALFYLAGADLTIANQEAGFLRLINNGGERLRFSASGAWGVAGENYGTSGQVLTSNGSAAAPSWQTVTSPIAQTAQVISQNVTLTTGSNGLSVGPVEVAATYAVTVPDNATWMVLS